MQYTREARLLPEPRAAFESLRGRLRFFRCEREGVSPKPLFPQWIYA